MNADIVAVRDNGIPVVLGGSRSWLSKGHWEPNPTKAHWRYPGTWWLAARDRIKGAPWERFVWDQPIPEQFHGFTVLVRLVQP